jgi:hypothetical protein
MVLIEVKSDKEIYNMANAEWVGILTQLWDACGKPVEKQRLSVYRKQLEDVSLGILEKAIKNLLREHVYSNVPTIGEIWQEVKRLQADGCESELRLYRFWQDKPIEPILINYPDRSALPSAYDTATGWWKEHMEAKA